MVLPFPVLINDVRLCVTCKHYISESALTKSLGGVDEGYGGQVVVGQVLDSSRGRGMTAIQPWLWKMCHVSQCTGMEGMDPGSGAGMTEGGVGGVG